MFLFYILMLMMILAFSWALTCGIVYLIFCCFSLVFSWPVATGIWLILLILGSVFRRK